MKVLDKILYFIDSISLWTGRILAGLCVIMVLVVCYNVFMRYLFRAPPIWAFDLARLMLLTAGCLGGAYATLSRSHIRVDIFYAKYSPKKKALVDGLIYGPFVIISAILVVWYGWKMTWYAITSGALLSSLWVFPLWPFYIMLPIGGFLIGLQAIPTWIRDGYMLATGKELESKVFKGKGIRAVK